MHIILKKGEIYSILCPENVGDPAQCSLHEVFESPIQFLYPWMLTVSGDIISTFVGMTLGPLFAS